MTRVKKIHIFPMNLNKSLKILYKKKHIFLQKCDSGIGFIRFFALLTICKFESTNMKQSATQNTQQNNFELHMLSELLSSNDSMLRNYVGVLPGRPDSRMWCPQVIGRDSWVWVKQKALFKRIPPTRWGRRP